MEENVIAQKRIQESPFNVSCDVYEKKLPCICDVIGRFEAPKAVKAARIRFLGSRTGYKGKKI